MEWKVIDTIINAKFELNYICIQAYKNLKLILWIAPEHTVKAGDILRETPEGYSVDSEHSSSLTVYHLFPYCRERWQSLDLNH